MPADPANLPGRPLPFRASSSRSKIGHQRGEDDAKHTAQSTGSTSDRSRNRHPARALGSGRLHRARGARTPLRRWRRRLYDRAQADADHARQGPGRTRRCAARARLSRCGKQAAHTEALPFRDGHTPVQRLAIAARAACARRGAACIESGIEADPRVARSHRWWRQIAMNALTAELVPYVHALGWSLLHFLWQGTLIGLAYVLLRGMCGTSVARHRLGMLCLLAMLACPLVTLALLWPAPVDPAGLSAALSSVSTASASASAEATPAGVEAWLPWCVGLWLVGVCMIALRSFLHWRHLAALVRSATALPRDWQLRLIELRQRFGILRP